MEKIGFVVPVFNVKKEYLQQCIKSICDQTYHNIEILIVDDYSANECALFCDYLATQDDRIKVFHHEKNKGLPGARNTGIEKSDADWLAFIDGDDWVEKDMAEKLISEIEETDADIYVYSGYRNYPDKEVCCSHVYDHRTVFKTVEERNAFEETFLFNQTNAHVVHSFPIQSACIRLVSRKLFDAGLRFVDVKFAEDALFHLYSTEYSKGIVYLRYNFYHYRNTENSMVNSYRENAHIEQTNVVCEIWKFAEDYHKGERFKDGIYLYTFTAMQMCIWQKYFNPSCPLSYWKSQRQCKDLFDKFPYKGVFNHIHFNTLRKNQKIKYCLLRLKLYQAVVLFRNMHNNKNGKIC